MIGQAIEDKIAQTFDQMTLEVQNFYIQQWTLEIYVWLNRARSYVEQAKKISEDFQLTKSASDSLDKIKTMLQKRRIAKDMITNQTILLDGYVLLNKIGETIRAEEIYYSITVSKSGEGLASGAQDVYTIKIPLSEFTQFLNFTKERIVMKNPSTIYKMIENQINQDDNNINYEKWNEKKLQDFTLFAHQVRSNPHWPNWHNVNEGNLLEAFFRLLNDGQVPSTKTNAAYWKNLGSIMKRTMQSPDKFFIGGDINDLQIKGLNASVTNINTLIANLTKVLNILINSKSGIETITKYLRKNYISENIDKIIEQNQEEVINNLTKFFTSKIVRD